MKIGLIGLQGSGKTTVFELILRQSGQEMKYGTYGDERLKPHIGTVFVRDERLEELARILKPKKTTYAEIIFIDRPGFDMVHAKEVDSLVLVIGLFLGRDGAKDITDVEAELILSDLSIVQNRLKKLEKEIKAKEAKDEVEYNLLLRANKILEDGGILKGAGFTESEDFILHGYQFLTLKPLLLVVNLAESELGKPLAANLSELLSKKRLGYIELCAETELEIMDLAEEERLEYLSSLGIKEIIHDKLIKAVFETMNLISFFTIKGDEARAWPVKKGTKALDAAGKVHTDMKRGFIRAEVVNFKDFIASGGSLHEAKAKGHLLLEGRDYIVKDGDIIDFRFSV